MRRLAFISILAGAVVISSAARAQQAMPVIGFLSGGSSEEYANRVYAFLQGLTETGHVEGRNVAIEYRWASGRFDRLPEFAADLVRRRVAVIVANGRAALVAKAATTTIPIVFDLATDPVKLGLVASLSRPGGNLTGVSNLNVELGPKRLELLHEVVPGAAAVALLVNPANPNAVILTKDMSTAARRLGVTLHVLNAGSDGEIDAAFATVIERRMGALVIGPDPFFNSRSKRLAALSVRYAVPAIYQYREFAAAGGLMGYGGSITDAYRFVGVYTGRVLKGEKPSDLPVQQSTKAELFLNLKTAKALGLTVPLSLLGRADEVIE